MLDTTVSKMLIFKKFSYCPKNKFQLEQKSK